MFPVFVIPAKGNLKQISDGCHHDTDMTVRVCTSLKQCIMGVKKGVRDEVNSVSKTVKVLHFLSLFFLWEGVLCFCAVYHQHGPHHFEEMGYLHLRVKRRS